MSIAQRIVISKFGGETDETRVYHTTTEISDLSVRSYGNNEFSRPLREESMNAAKKHGPIGKSLVECLLPLDGVNEIVLEPYSVRIKKAQAFRWEDVEPKVLETLQDLAFERSSRVQVYRGKPDDDANIQTYSERLARRAIALGFERHLKQNFDTQA